MRYYRSNRKISLKAKKIIFRVIFTIAAAALILTLTLIIGNNLKKKVDSVEDAGRNTHASEGMTAERKVDESSINSSYSPTVFGTQLNISDYADENGKPVFELLDLISKTYDTVTIDLTDENGELIYSSEAMCNITRIPVDQSNTNASLIRSVTGYAKDKGLRTCAILNPMMPELSISGAASIDSALIAELGDMGFDEVLLDFTESVRADVSYETASRIRTYLTECSTLSEDVCSIGIILSKEVYMNAASAKQVQLMASASSFIAIDFDLEGQYYTDVVYNDISNIVTSLLGNFSVYNMRVMIWSDYDIICSSAFSACAEHGVKNVVFSRYVSPEVLEFPDDSIEEHEEKQQEDPEEEKNVSNPYATTKDNPSIGAKDGLDDIPDEYINGSDGEEDEISPRPWY